MSNLGPTPVIHGNQIQENGLKNNFFFNPQLWTVVGDGCGRQEPFDRKLEFPKNPYNEELKLFIGRLNFLNYYWNPSKVKNPTILCINSGQGKNISLLANLFPMIKFELYDTRPANPVLRTQRNITIFNQDFTYDVAKKYTDRTDVFMIYDYNDSSSSSSSSMTRQLEMFQYIKPVKALLKYEPQNDELYLDGDIYFTSHSNDSYFDSFLVPDSTLPLRKWNFKTYNEMVFYHHNIIRPYVNFINPLTNTNTPISNELKLNRSFDDSHFVLTVKRYLEKYNVEIIPDQILMICKNILTQL